MLAKNGILLEMPTVLRSMQGWVMAQGISPEQEAFLFRIRDVLEKHHKMPATNTVYDNNKNIKDRDVICLCGYKGVLGWWQHVLEEFHKNDIWLISAEEAAELTIAKAR